MSERIGICQDCGQRYGDIPATVTATKVRCQVCGGTVNIPPLTSAALADSLAAKPVGDTPKKKADRPTAAAPVDREVARPAKKERAKKGKPGKPVFAPKKPGKPVKKISAPIKSVKPAVKPTSEKSIAPPKATATPVDGQAAKKARAAEIIAKAKAKRAAESDDSKPVAARVEAKPSGAQLLAQLKAKRDSDSQAAAQVASKPGDTSKSVTKKVAAKTGGVRRSSAKRSSSRRDEDSESESGRRGRRPQRKQESTTGLLVFSLVGVVVLIGGWLWWQSQQGNESNNVEVSGPESPIAGKVGDGDLAPVVDSAPPPVQPLNDINNSSVVGTSGNTTAPETSIGETDAASTVTNDLGLKEDPAPPAQAPTPPPSRGADFIVPGPGEGVQTRGITDPDVLDLKAVPQLPKFKGSTDEEFAELREDLELYLEDGGAQSNRAGNRVVDAGRAAFPVIINAMMKLDYTTREGHYTGGTLNQLIYRAGNENKNYAWEPADRSDPGSAEFRKANLWNKKVVGSLHRLWVEQLSENDDAWERYVTKAPPSGGE
ncbi:MAG: hypothetical protein MK209_07275 [Planctomycetes bacterium]|nr:hypothetical protein [Planctomycetota bacterium]